MDITLSYPNGPPIPVKVGPTIAKGNHASVHSVVNLPCSAVKIFHESDRYNAVHHRYLRRKLTAMVGNASPYAGPDVEIAWPAALACDGRNDPIGYAMPLLPSDFTPLHDADSAAWNSAAAAAIANALPALRQLHLQDIVIGDISPANILADQTGQRIGLVDCDGWQFRDRNDQRLYIAQGWTRPYIPSSLRTAPSRHTMPNCINPDCPQAGSIHSQRPYACSPRLPEHDLEALAIMARCHAASTLPPA